MIEKLFTYNYLDSHSLIGHLYVIFITILGFGLFNAVDLSSLSLQLANMFALSDIPLLSYETIYYLRSYGIIIIISLIASTPLLKTIVSKLKENEKIKLFIDFVEPLVYVGLFIIVVAYLVDGSFNPFLYFRF